MMIVFTVLLVLTVSAIIGGGIWAVYSIQEADRRAYAQLDELESLWRRSMYQSSHATTIEFEPAARPRAKPYESPVLPRTAYQERQSGRFFSVPPTKPLSVHKGPVRGSSVKARPAPSQTSKSSSSYSPPIDDGVGALIGLSVSVMDFGSSISDAVSSCDFGSSISCDL